MISIISTVLELQMESLALADLKTESILKQIIWLSEILFSREKESTAESLPKTCRSVKNQENTALHTTSW